MYCIYTIYLYVCMSAQSLSHVQLFATTWTVACQAPLPMEFSRQQYWTELPLPTSGDLPDTGIEPVSLVSPKWQADSLPLHHLGSHVHIYSTYLCMYIFKCNSYAYENTYKCVYIIHIYYTYIYIYISFSDSSCYRLL